MPANSYQQPRAPFTVDPSEAHNNGGGKTCPRCGYTNSYSKMTGLSLVLIVVLFFTCLGLLAIPFLPKNWTCRACGNVW